MLLIFDLFRMLFVLLQKKEEETNDYVYMYDDDDKIDQYHIFFFRLAIAPDFIVFTDFVVVCV